MDNIHPDEQILPCNNLISFNNLNAANYLLQDVESLPSRTVLEQTESDQNNQAYNCLYCEQLFPSNYHLANHIEAVHINQSGVNCNFCDLYCPNMMLLSDHINSFHGQSATEIDLLNYGESNLLPTNPIYCYTCGLDFWDMNNLNLHVELFHPEHYHQATVSFPGVSSEEISYFEENNVSSANPAYSHYACEICRISFPLHEDLERHVDIEHNDHTIPQVDGIDQDLFVFTDVSPTVRTASFSLNQSKQVTKIREDAKLNDYEVTVNNGDQNVTIKCSSGFYIQVAKASFALDRSSTLSTGKIGISVDEIIITKD